VKYRYDAYGNILGLIDNSIGDIISTMNPYTYRGYRYDSEIGYYYLNSRYYNPETGRFINADGMLGEMGDIPSTNMYAYCANNPVMNSDSLGQFWETIIDVGFTILGLVDLIKDPTWENAGWFALDLLFLAIPFIPGVARGAKAVTKIDDFTDIASFVNCGQDIFVIGQNMGQRVIPYADEIGALYYKGYRHYGEIAKVSGKLANAAGYMHNMAFVASKSVMGARFIDIGMDASRAGNAMYNFSRFTVYSERFVAETARMKNVLRTIRRIFYD
jgi:RHS repeat-associated protein